MISGNSENDKCSRCFWMWPALLCLLVVILDQVTKSLIVDSFQEMQALTVVPNFFNLVLVYNRGAAFGSFSGLADGYRQLVLTLTTVVALGLVIYFLLFEYRKDRIAHFALAGIIGGAVGNLIDRLRYGYVIDFLDFFVGSYHWPAFNVADSFICIGVTLLILRGAFKKKCCTESVQGEISTK